MVIINDYMCKKCKVHLICPCHTENVKKIISNGVDMGLQSWPPGVFGHNTSFAVTYISPL